ncbi:hypothetical protein [Okeania sp. SIO1I7]|nr:hypothetical protein [Okeania sp. SIO1I7]NET29854.1 hypothetical protein [Okeania sp. SIO1I7]
MKGDRSIAKKEAIAFFPAYFWAFEVGASGLPLGSRGDGANMEHFN